MALLINKVTNRFEGKPFAVIHEGLLPYLIREEKQAMAGNLHSILKPQDGIYVTPDVVTKTRYKAMIDGNPSVADLLAAISGATARNMVDNAFEDWEDAVRFYEQSGFSIDRRPYYNGTYELSSVCRLKSDSERVMAMIRPREVWVMRARGSSHKHHDNLVGIVGLKGVFPKSPRQNPMEKVLGKWL